MFHAAHANPKKIARVPEDATFVWRNGCWFVQGRRDAVLKPLSQRNSKVLEQLRRAGRLEEPSPGQFRISGVVSQPVVDSGESPLFRLGVMKQADGSTVLDVEQLRAGDRLRRDYESAHLAARVTMNYDTEGGSRGQRAFSDNHIEGLSDGAIAARQSLHGALDAVGPELAGILLHVCCMAGGLEQAEMRLNLPRRAGKAVLQLALTRLARHYGFKAALRHEGPAKIGQWAVANYRPGIV